jgi:hypothetical protein
LQATAGNSAVWVKHGQNTYAALTVNNADAGSNALIAVSRFSSTLPTTQPSFTTTNYAAGTPRIVVMMADGNTLFIYPDGSAEWIGHGPITYSTFAANESASTVSAVYIVADASQTVPYTANVTAFQYNGVNLIG